MTTVIAAIDRDEARLPVLQAAELLGAVYEAGLEIYHVVPHGAPVPDLGPEFAGLAVRELHGDVAAALAHEIERPDVVACAIGARSGPDAPSPTGHIAIEVLRRVDKPVALVPPSARLLGTGRIRVLVPLDGSEEADLTVQAVVTRVAHADVDVVVLHVFDESSVPAFLDRPEHDLPAWSHEFLRRHCDEEGATVVWRAGRPGVTIADAAASEGVDGVILGWHGVLEPGRAAVVREVLAGAGVPILMVPRAQAERTIAEAAAARG
jgi:hypothetical protein